MIQCFADLTRSVQPNIRELSDELLSNDFVSVDSHRSMNNQMFCLADRAAQLVSLVITRVQLNPSNFHRSISILLKNEPIHEGILETLAMKYKSLGK